MPSGMRAAFVHKEFAGNQTVFLPAAELGKIISALKTNGA